jgi:hypothetical protein
MVIAQLNGGLGNQMFQYANGRAIAYRRQAPLGLDNSILLRGYSRPYKLCYLNISADIVATDQLNLVQGDGRTKVGAFIDYISQHLRPYYRRKIYRERSQRYDPNILRIYPPVYLVGYWQSEKYFKDIEGLIRREFKLIQHADSRNSEMLGQIQACNSVSVHIRRGDYVTNPVIREAHGACSSDYYQNAIQIIARLVTNPHFFIFSDDMEWSRSNIRLNYPATFVSHNGVERDHEDLRLMSQCKHHIIANSSFSWWGAWLAENPYKIVIAPTNWFNDRSRDSRDIVPEGWTRI